MRAVPGLFGRAKIIGRHADTFGNHPRCDGVQFQLQAGSAKAKQIVEQQSENR